MALAPGDRVDHYVIEAPLGEGGLGRVYRALDERLGRRVALKVLREGREEGGLLLNEARMAAQVVHPNVVAVHGVGEVDGKTYIAMELALGSTLRARMQGTDVPLTERVRLLREVGRALSAAHAKGVVHRDIKPENVMIGDDGSVKVVDFGIANPMPGAPVDLSSLQGTVTTLRRAGLAGTPAYMAPEQLRGDPVDARTDQFSWGVMAYEVLTGRDPWSSRGDAYRLAAAILTREPPAPRAIDAAIPVPIEAVILRAMRKAPGDRFGAFDELLAQLDTTPALPEARGGGRSWIAGAAVAAALVAVALLGMSGAREGAQISRAVSPSAAPPPAPLANPVTVVAAPSATPSSPPPLLTISSGGSPKAATPASDTPRAISSARRAPPRPSPSSSSTWERGSNGAQILE